MMIQIQMQADRKTNPTGQRQEAGEQHGRQVGLWDRYKDRNTDGHTGQVEGCYYHSG